MFDVRLRSSPIDLNIIMKVDFPFDSRHDISPDKLTTDKFSIARSIILCWLRVISVPPANDFLMTHTYLNVMCVTDNSSALSNSLSGSTGSDTLGFIPASI
jgi:hypothetical protein